MRYLFVIVFALFLQVSKGQSFVTYQDTINHFSISIPVGWKYMFPQKYPSIKLMVYRTPDSPTDTTRDTYNLNILHTPNLSLDETYAKFLTSLQGADSFNLIDSGDTTINGNTFKWLLETHTNQIGKMQMQNYVLVTYQHNKSYILTFATFSNRFEIVKSIFDTISGSFFLTE
jgi:hypothetical protein